MKFTLTATDTMASVLQSMAPETGVTQKQSYSAYGDTVESANDVQIPGFNGERRDPLTGTTHLGNGYRAYNPSLMRFHAPDSMSPFGAGGLNCYAYCNGDPINNSDPSGHMSVQAGAGIGLGVLGLALGAASFGVSIAAKVAVVASVSAIATGIASIATENSNPEASAALGWASMGLGIAGAATGVFSAAKGIQNSGVSKRLQILKTKGMSGDPAQAARAMRSGMSGQRGMGHVASGRSTAPPTAFTHMRPNDARSDLNSRILEFRFYYEDKARNSPRRDVRLDENSRFYSRLQIPTYSDDFLEQYPLSPDQNSSMSKILYDAEDWFRVKPQKFDMSPPPAYVRPVEGSKYAQFVGVPNYSQVDPYPHPSYDDLFPENERL